MSILMSEAYWLHLMCYGGDVRHIELHGVYLCSGVRVPDSTAIFQDRSDKGEVSLSFYLD